MPRHKKDGTPNPCSFQPWYKKKGTHFIPFKRWITYEGQRLRIYSIGWLAHFTYRTQKRIRDWIKEGILPRPILDLADGRYWWTSAELIGYAIIVKEAKLRPGFNTLMPMRERMHEFKRRLKRLYRNEPERIQKMLDNEDVDWRDVLFRKREVRWKKEASSLLKYIPRIKNEWEIGNQAKNINAMNLQRAKNRKKAGGKIKYGHFPDDMRVYAPKDRETDEERFRKVVVDRRQPDRF